MRASHSDENIDDANIDIQYEDRTSSNCQPPLCSLRSGKGKTIVTNIIATRRRDSKLFLQPVNGAAVAVAGNFSGRYVMQDGQLVLKGTDNFTLIAGMFGLLSRPESPIDIDSSTDNGGSGGAEQDGTESTVAEAVKPPRVKRTLASGAQMWVPAGTAPDDDDWEFATVSACKPLCTQSR
jgi:hypothetical protein